MGALTSNRKRGDDYFTFNSKFPYSSSPNPDNRIDTHVSKKPKTSSSMQLTPERPRISVSRVFSYPKPVNPIPREVHAPCRGTRFGFRLSSNRESRPKSISSGKEEDSADEMGNVLTDNYYRARNGLIQSLRYVNKGEEVIDVDAEIDKGDVSGDSRIDEVEVAEDEQKLQENGKVVVLEHNFQPSSSSVVSDWTNTNTKTDDAGKKLELLLLNGESNVWDLPVHKKLYQTAERRNPKLNRLNFQIVLAEKLWTASKFFRRAKKLEDEHVLPDAHDEPFVPLTNEEEAEVSQAFSNSSRNKAVAENSNMVITGESLQCLRPKAWLNDEVINVYLELLKEREKREPNKFLKCHFFNSFFYKKLISGKNGYDFKSVRRWTSQRNLGYCLLECDKIFVPIHKQNHWCLAVINKKDKKFQYLDSLKGIDNNVLNVLARYFVDEVKDKSEVDIDVHSWEQEYIEDLPEQENGYDCGVFMIKYADFYSRGLGLRFKQVAPCVRKWPSQQVQTPILRIFDAGV